MIRKYEHILATMRMQIKSLKGQVLAADEPRRSPQKRTEEEWISSPSPVLCTQDFALVEFKEELVRKEFELEECLLELEEVKNELKKQSSRQVPPLQLLNVHSDDPSPHAALQPALSWEDDVQVRDDFTPTKDDPEFAPEAEQQMSETELLRQKVDVVERENRLLREKVELCDSEIKSLMSRSARPDTLEKMRTDRNERDFRATEPAGKGRAEERMREERGRSKKASAPQSRQRSVEDYERELATMREDLVEKERLLAASSYRASQLADDLRNSHPRLGTLWREVKEELNRDIGSPRSGAMQRKIETLQGSFNSSALHAAAMSTLLSEKDEALAEMTRRYNALAEQYRSVVKSQGLSPPKSASQPRETAELASLLSEKETALADLTKRFNTLSEQHNALLQSQNEQQLEAKEKEIAALRTQIESKDSSIVELHRKLADLSEQFDVMQKAQSDTRVEPEETEEAVAEPIRRPTPGGESRTTPGALKPMVNAMKEGMKKAGMLDPRASLGKKMGTVMRGKPGGGRTPR